MKRTLRILAAGLAASLALVSCDKESLTKTDNGASKDGVRTITVSFTATRSELDGYQPKFKTGDEIMLRDQSGNTDTKSVTVSKGVATVSTSLTGELTAVYPASASTDGKTFTVSSSQDGTFANANICTATIPDGANPKAEFVNQTAILKFSVPAKADDKGVNYSPKTIKVKSRGSENIADGSNEITITGKGENGIITPSDGGFYYMAVLPGETISKLTVCSGEGMRCPTASGTLTANFIYDVALPVLNGHEYVELTMTVNSVTKTYKWATTNVGASSPTEYGDYFAWGDTDGQTWNGSSWSNGGFNTAPTLTPANPETLPLQYDAANVNWGGSWRMPTKSEFETLVVAKKISCNSDGGTFGETSANIYLPAAGYGDGASFLAGNSYYWTSSLNSVYSGNAYYIYFDEDFAYLDSFTRNRGRSVRPLSE